MEENSSSLLFTNDVYQLILNEIICFEWQKCHLDRNLQGCLHNFTIPELQAWLGLTLNMGLVRKNSINSYWSKNSVIQTPFFPNTMSRDHYLHILRFLPFTDNDNAPDLYGIWINCEDKAIFECFATKIHSSLCTFTEFIFG